jgi:hypothetical protein
MIRSDIKTALQALGYGTDTDTQQNEAISSTVRRVAGMHRWPWQELHVATGALAVGASTVTSVPTDVLHLDSVRAESGTNYIEPAWMNAQDLRSALHIDRDNGVPENWTRHAGSVLVYPRADLAYTITMDYVKIPTVPAADGTELPFPTPTTTS